MFLIYKKIEYCEEDFIENNDDDIFKARNSLIIQVKSLIIQVNWSSI